jgi:signal transduction histidine kinase
MDEGGSSSRRIPRSARSSYAAPMSVIRLPRWQLGAVVGASAVAAAGLVGPGMRSPVDWAFVTVVLSALGVLTLRVALEWRDAARARSRASALTRIAPDDIAREAVRAERQRLMVEISAGLRTLLSDVRDAARHESADPGAAAARIHEASRAATAELRRQLGLLRSVEEPAPPTAAEDAERGATPSRGDVALASLATVLAAVETVLWPSLDGRSVSAASVVLGALAAGTVLARHAWPVPGALACAAVFTLAVALSVPLYPGLWFLVSAGALLWSVAARGRSPWPALGAVATLGTAVLVQVGLTEPQNVAFDAVVMGVAAAGGLLARAARCRAELARRRAEGADALIAAATRDAVDAERAAFARELHDTVSHAVGLIALQSAAAMVSAEHDPPTARASLDLVRWTAQAALAELDLADVGTARPRTTADLEGLVERIRAAGTRVDLSLGALGGTDLPEPAYRVVQESLTNVVRHARGARASVRVALEHDLLVVEVSDDGPGVVAGAERGYGLVGLGERVRFAGGTLSTSAGAHGLGFRVRAVLPPPLPAGSPA